MPSMIRSVIVLPVLAAVGVLVAGCGSSSTAPQTTPSQYAGSYQGIAAGAGASGTVAITVGQVSSDMTRGPVLHAESSTPVTVTLTTSSGPVTLTGTITGNVASVSSSTTPPGSCTITFTTTMGATGTCTLPGLGTVNLVAALIQEGVVTTTYCGTQSAGAAARVDPTATLGALVSGPNVYMVVAPPTGSPALYSGMLSGQSVTLASTSSGVVYTGVESSDKDTLSGTITSGGPGSWSVVSPCVTGALTLSTTSVSASATVGSTTTIPLAAVTISNGGSGTLGVLSVGPVTYGSGATGWLQAALSSLTTTGGTLSLSVLPTGIAAATYTATVPVTSSVASGSPQTVTVTLTVNGAQAPPVLGVLQSSYPFQMMQGQGAPGPNTDGITLTGGTVPVQLAVAVTYPQDATPWLTATLPVGVTSISPGGQVILTMTPMNVVTNFLSGTFPATIEITSPGLAPVTVSATLNVMGTSPTCTLATNPPAFPPLTVGTVAEVIMTYTGAGCPTAGNYKWTVTPGSLPAGLAFSANSDVIYGVPTGPSGGTGANPYNGFTINMVNTATSAIVNSLPFGGGTAAAEAGCQIGPHPAPNGTEGVYDAQGFVASTTCTSASDNSADWNWSISGDIPPGMNLVGQLHGVAVLFAGTPTTAGTFDFTITFANTNQVAGQNEASATQTYTMTINAPPGSDRVRTAVTRAGTK